MSSINTYNQTERYRVNSMEDLEKVSQRNIAVFRRVLGGRKFKKILDAGCGEGILARLIKDQWGAEVYGVDISKRGVALARGFRIKAKVADISKKIPFKRNFFDLVTCTQTIEHLSDPDRLLTEIHRVLKPNGMLLLTTPNLSSWTNRFLFSIGIYPIFLEASTQAKVGYGPFSRFLSSPQLVGHIHVFNLRALRDLLKFHKFLPESIVGSRVRFEAPSDKFITIIYNAIDAVMAKIPSLSSDMVVLARKL